jgi:hypothetical protein
MKKAALMALIWGFGLNALAFPAKQLTNEDKIAIAKERCTPKTVEEGVLYNNAFKGFNRSIEDLDSMYPEIYNSVDRLVNRVGYFEDTQSFVSKDTFTKTETQVVFPESLITAVTLQVENSLRLNYVKYVFFPDMGHTHLFIPQGYYETEMSQVRGFFPSLEVALKAPGLKLLYHTAEQLEMIDDEKKVLADRYLQWRFYTRNPTGDLRGNIEILSDYDPEQGGHNTVRNLEGYKYYSGFNISANKDGCFPFQDKTGAIQYFDLSAWDLPYQPGVGDSYYFAEGNSGHSNAYRKPNVRQF